MIVMSLKCYWQAFCPPGVSKTSRGIKGYFFYRQFYCSTVYSNYFKSTSIGIVLAVVQGRCSYAHRCPVTSWFRIDISFTSVSRLPSKRNSTDMLVSANQLVYFRSVRLNMKIHSWYTPALYYHIYLPVIFTPPSSDAGIRSKAHGIADHRLFSP